LHAQGDYLHTVLDAPGADARLSALDPVTTSAMIMTTLLLCAVDGRPGQLRHHP